MFDFRTDMADERNDIYRKVNKLDNVPGIETYINQIDEKIKTNIVKVVNSEGEEAIGKPIGTYITIDVKDIKYALDDDKEKAINVVKDELKKIIDMHCNPQDEILVVGLGNQFVTPDALGPKVISELEVTRHFIKYTPQYVVEGTRSVCAIAPGVLGTTGLETLEIIKGIVDNIKPKLLIVIDSLASKSIERISSTIQIADTGIVPGGGVENARKELSINTLGIPVVAIGVPMVVESAVLVNDCLDIFIQKLQDEAKSNDYLNQLKAKDNYNDIKESLNPSGYNMIVTPKEIDDLIENMKDIVAGGINLSV